jgi:hypothetical protein
MIGFGLVCQMIDLCEDKLNLRKSINELKVSSVQSVQRDIVRKGDMSSSQVTDNI